MAIRDLVQRERPFNVPQQQRHRFGRTLMSLQDEMDRLLQDFWGETTGLTKWRERMEVYPAVDVIENDKHFKVKVELSGLEPENVDVSVSDDSLVIKGERTEEKEVKDENYLCREISCGSFQRTIALPETANCEKADASFKNGILTVKVPKKAGAKQKPKKLQIKKAA